MTRRATLSALAGALLLLAPGAASADDPQDLEALLGQTVISTASQTKETEATAPAVSTSLSGEDLRRYGLRTLEEAINFLSLGVASGGGVSTTGESDMGARGVLLSRDSGSHFLLLIDGHAVNEPFYGTARFDRGAGVPLEVIDHIEVIVGPGSVLYGSNAMLGVIHVITRRAKDFSGTRVWASSELPISARVGAGAGYLFPLAGAKAELTAAAEFYERRGPSMTLGPQQLGRETITRSLIRTTRGGEATGVWGGEATAGSHERVPSGLVRLRVGGLDVELRGLLVRRATPFGTSDFDDPDSFMLTRAASLDVRYHRVLSSSMELTVRAYGDTYDTRTTVNSSRQIFCVFPGVATCSYQVTAGSRWGGVEAQASYDWRKDGRLVTLIGVDGRMRSVGSLNGVTDLATGAHLKSSDGIVDRDLGAVGAYAQQTWQATDALAFNLGARLDVDPRFDAVASPRLAGSYAVWDGGTARVIYSQAFRAPAFFETDFSDAVRLRSVDLRPERVRSVEASIEQRFGANRVLFGVFRTSWTDLVGLRQLSDAEALAAVAAGRLSFYSPETPRQEFRNVSAIESYGYNASLEGSAAERRLRYGLNLTGAHSRQEDRGHRPLPVAPQFFGNARVSYAPGAALPTLSLAAFLLGPRLADRADDGGFSPPPAVPTQIELRTAATGDVPGLKGLGYQLALAVTSSTRSPYVIGPSQQATALQPSAELAPVDRLRAIVGLSYQVLP